MMSSIETVGPYVASVRTAEYDRWAEAHMTWVEAQRIAPHMPGTQQARITAEVAFRDAVRASYEYAGLPMPNQSELAAGLIPYPVP